jgi:hypothetical protein
MTQKALLQNTGYLDESIAAGVQIPIPTYETGSFTATLTGCTTSPTTTVTYVRVGKIVILNCSPLLGTSNSTSAAITGLPASIRPLGGISFLVRISDNTNGLPGLMDIASNGTINLYSTANGIGFVASGTKGIYAFSVSYIIP